MTTYYVKLRGTPTIIEIDAEKFDDVPAEGLSDFGPPESADCWNTNP